MADLVEALDAAAKIGSLIVAWRKQRRERVQDLAVMELLADRRPIVPGVKAKEAS